MDVKFILVSNDTKNSMQKHVLAEKSQLSRRVLKMADFDQSAKGEPFAKFPKSVIFLAELRKAQNVGDT